MVNSPQGDWRGFLRRHNELVTGLIRTSIERNQYKQARNLALIVLAPRFLLTWLLMRGENQVTDWRLIVLLAAVSPAAAMLTWALNSTLLFVSGRVFGGKSRWMDNMIGVSFSYTPHILQLLLFPLSLVPLLAPLYLLVSAATFLWSVYLLFLSQRVVNGFNGRQAFKTILLSGILILVLMLLLLSSAEI